MKKIVTIGGGTGTYVVLSGLKKYDFDLVVVVSMMDSGGSTGRLRDQLGVLPPGDLRQCLVALSESSDLWRKLFLYRFDNGDLKGHNFGNIFITALEKIMPDYEKVVETASFILKTKGRVIPVTHDKVHLCVRYEDGEVIEEESVIDTATHKSERIVQAYLSPNASANRNALKAIEESDYIIIGPGDLYTSLIPNLLVDGIDYSIMHSSAKIIIIMNLMTKKGQTTNYTMSDHIQDLEKHLKKKIDIILINDQKIPDNVIAYYVQFGEIQVVDDTKAMNGAYIIRYAPMISDSMHEQSVHDSTQRSLLRHDSDKLARVIYEIITH